MRGPVNGYAINAGGANAPQPFPPISNSPPPYPTLDGAPRFPTIGDMPSSSLPARGPSYNAAEEIDLSDKPSDCLNGLGNCRGTFRSR